MFEPQPCCLSTYRPIDLSTLLHPSLLVPLRVLTRVVSLPKQNQSGTIELDEFARFLGRSEEKVKTQRAGVAV